MANYSTNLKTWGGTGEAFPDGYSYVEGEQPVDAWDNFVNYNLISDVSDHLIPLTNSRIETDKGASGNEPSSPETSHLYSDEDNEVLRRWNDTASVWRNIATEYWVNNSADVPNADYADDAGTLQGKSPEDLRGFTYVQSTEPSSPADGESWADTSDPARTVYVYSADTGSWRSVDDTVQALRDNSGTESGSFSNYGSNVTVSFTNTYDSDIFAPTVAAGGSSTGDGQDVGGAWITSINTDGSGNVTGMDIRTSVYGSAEQITCSWRVWGVQV